MRSLSYSITKEGNSTVRLFVLRTLSFFDREGEPGMDKPNMQSRPSKYASILLSVNISKMFSRIPQRDLRAVFANTIKVLAGD